MNRAAHFIPFPQVWKNSFKKMEAASLLKYMADENLRGNLLEHFEGKLVLIGDISTGSSDLGQTPLEGNEPLILIHASLLNAMLTGTFYGQWSSGGVVGILLIIGSALGLAACMRPSWYLYGTGIIVAIGLTGLTWFEFIHFRLFPIATVGGSALTDFLGLVFVIEMAVGKERSFIRNAFSMYVPRR